MNRRGLLGEIAIVVILLVVGFFYFVGNFEEDVSCVPDSCCHAAGCVLESEAPNCSDVVCTQECRDGTMDCGAGSCAFVDGNCEVVWNEED